MEDNELDRLKKMVSEIQQRVDEGLPEEKVVLTYQYLGYEIRRIVNRFDPEEKLTRDKAFTDKDEYIGGLEELEYLVTKCGLTQLQSAHEGVDSLTGRKVVNIGFNEAEQKWYGWSHRAMQKFGIGDKALKLYPGVKIEGATIRTLEEAKEAAAAFSESVS